MLVKDLPRMVRYLKDRGTYVLFNTNGTVLTPKNGRELDRRRPRRAARLARCRRCAHVPAGARQGLLQPHRAQRARASREMQEREGHERPRVSLWLTGLKETIDQLPAFVRVAADIGVKEVYLQRLVYFEDDADRHGAARPGAVRAPDAGRSRMHLDAATALARSLGMTLQRLRRAPSPA